jgi:5-methylcytosine-specific restriction endonuclease McrA
MTVDEMLAGKPLKRLSADAKAGLDQGRGLLRSLRSDATKARSEPATKKFYSSRAWRALRYRVLKARSARCECCGRTAKDGCVICVDHVEAVKKDWSRRLDETNLQVLCGDCNLAKGSDDATDWRNNYRRCPRPVRSGKR